MKKNCLLLLVILLTSINFSYAQTNTFPSSGNAGIGTNTPAAWGASYKVLDFYSYGFIFGSSNGTGYSGVGYGQTAWGNNSYYDGTSHAIGTGAASSLLQGTGYLIFQNAPSVSAGGTQTFTERFRIDNSGNVGIGTSSPSTALDIGGRIQISSDNSSVPPAGLSYGLFPYGGVGLGLYSGAIGPNQGIGIWTNPGGAPTEVMRISSGGNVGIGTTNPDAKLAVNGTIHSKEVKVDMNILPDYVFQPTYDLPSLKAIKAYVDQYHHLPDVPSAQQVAKEGLNLGEMNAVLLKKVEELTLYLIEKDKQVADQQKVNASLQEQINQLAWAKNNRN